VLDITPLSTAIQSASLSIIQTLFDHGGVATSGHVLHFAIWRKLDDRLEMIEYLLSKDPPPPLNLLMYQNEPYCYELQKFMGLGTPLHAAAEHGHLDIVQYLIGRGSDPFIRDSRGELAVDRAEKNKHKSVVRFLRSLPC